jgi:hypothetical protein
MYDSVRVLPAVSEIRKSNRYRPNGSPKSWNTQVEVEALVIERYELAILVTDHVAPVASQE